MEHRSLNKIGSMIAAGAIALMLVGCKGSTGSTGAPGVAGTNGTSGTNGTAGTNGTYVVNVASLTSAQWANLNPTITVTSVTTNGQPVVSFKVVDPNGNGIAGLDTLSYPIAAGTDAGGNTFTGYNKYTNLAFTIAKLVPGPTYTVNNGTSTTTMTGPSKWVSYLATTVPTASTTSKTSGAPAPSHPTSDANGVLVGAGDGTYTYTFYRDITKTAGIIAAAATANPTTDYTGLGDTTFDATKTTRVALMFSGAAPGTGSNTPTGVASATPAVNLAQITNVIYDFMPGTGAAAGTKVTAADTSREIVLLSSCNGCHTVLTFHGSRNNPQTCVTCHTGQMIFGSTAATVNAANTAFTSKSAANVNGTSVYDFPQLIHQIHMGNNLQMAGHDLAFNNPNNVNADATASFPVTNVQFPQNIANCATCHATSTAAPQAGNYATVPDRLACGGCHDAVNFTTGANHVGGVQLDDSLCQVCHTPVNIPLYHTPLMSNIDNGSNAPAQHVTVALTLNEAQATSYANLPPTAHAISYKIDSATINTAGNPVVTFEIVVDGKDATFGTWSAATPLAAEMLTSPADLAAGPELALAFGISQDGITSPSDYNWGHTSDGPAWTLRQIWNHTALGPKYQGATPVLASSTGVVATATAGVYSVTLDGFKVPTGTTTMGASIGLAGFVQTDFVFPAVLADSPAAKNFVTWSPAAPFTTTVVAPALPVTYSAAYTTGTGGLLLPALTVVAPFTGTGLVARRNIIDPNACNSCHENLGAFTPNPVAAANGALAAFGDNFSFHSNYMNNGQVCAFCHTTLGVDSGWSYNAKTWVHGIHAAGFRNNAYTAHTGADTGTSNSEFFNIEYPGILNNCEACHVPGSYDFANATNLAQVPNMLWDTVATGVGNTVGLGTVAGSYAPSLNKNTVPAVNTLPAAGLTTFASPWVSTSQVYGTGYTPYAPIVPSATWGTGTITAGVTGTDVVAGPGIVAAEGTSAVTSPITGACTGCHDSQADIGHMVANGGQFYTLRKNVPGYATNGGKLVSNEQCLICHGTGAVMDIKVVHMNF